MHKPAATSRYQELGHAATFRRFALGLAAFLVIPPLLLAGFVIVVDPYYVFGSPSWPGINEVRPLYEPHVITAKPYQVERIRPEAVILGSSRAEVGLDPGHPGWSVGNVFDFGLPASTEYEVMRAFLHAQAVGRPLKQAVVGLDFFAFNIFFPRSADQQTLQLAGDGTEEFASFLAAELAGRPIPKHDTPATIPAKPTEPLASAQRDQEKQQQQPWNEALYLAVNPDVTAAIARGEFKSGLEHYQLAGRAEHRLGGFVPSTWNEARYLKIYPDVAAAAARGEFLSGYHHYLVAGNAEGRSDGSIPRDWNEALYLRLNPDVAAEIQRGTFLDGYHHYLVAGRPEGRLGGSVPSTWNEVRYLKIYPDVAAAVVRGEFLSGYHHYLVAGKAEGRSDGSIPSDWNEALYVRLNADVAAEIKRGTFLDGYHHYLVAGRAERRQGGFMPPNWDDAAYLEVNPDVADQVAKGVYISGYHHYLAYGRSEGRLGGFQPPEWNEGDYLAANPEVRTEIALGEFRSGFIHYLIIGRKLGYLGGYPPADLSERAQLHWPWLYNWVLRTKDRLRLVFSTTAVSDSLATISRQSEPPPFNARGVRFFDGQDAALKKAGGVGSVIRVRLGGGGWGPWVTRPKLMYCFTNTDTGMTMFDPYRFMLRSAYAEGTDLRLFVTPLIAVDRVLFNALGLGERYDFWLRELARINEEEAARAGKPPLPLWDFGGLNSITREPVPKIGDTTPMHWFWEYSHYRQATGNLILDRIFDYREPNREVPEDFGVRLTGANIETQIAKVDADLAAWSEANSELTAPIVHGAQTLKDATHQSEATCW